GYSRATVLAAASCTLSSLCSAAVSATGSTAPRTPCSAASTEAALLTLALPPAPAPTSPGDAGVGAASSQGDLPVALPGITLTELADTTACVGGAVVAVV